MNATVNQMIEEIAKSPEDWTLRNITADALSDGGDEPASEAMRFLAAEKKRPYSSKNSGGAAWFNGDAVAPSNLGDAESDLPGWLYKAMEGGKEVANHRKYPDPVSAELAVLEAWKRAKSAPPAEGEANG